MIIVSVNEEGKKPSYFESLFVNAHLLHMSYSSLSASSLTISSGSSRGSLASSHGSLASSRGSLSSISFTDIYGLPQYDKSDTAVDYGHHMRYDPVSVDFHNKDIQYHESIGSPASGKQQRSLDTPLSLASLSSRSSLSSISPPSSPLDTPFLPASWDSPLVNKSEGYEEVAYTGASEILRAQGSVLGEDKGQEMVASKATEYSTRNEALSIINIPNSGGKFIFSHLYFVFRYQQNNEYRSVVTR